MRSDWIHGLRGGVQAAVIVSTVLAGGEALADAPKQRLNSIITLLEQRQPVTRGMPSTLRSPSGAHTAVMGLYVPSNFRDIAAYKSADFIFDGSMEHVFERNFPPFANYARALGAQNQRDRAPLIVKIHKIAPDPELAARHIGQQLDLGVSGIVFVNVGSPDEVRRGLAAMRYQSRGGTRPATVGSAPAFWGVSEQEYRRKADLWPLNPEGELINWVIIESREGLKNVRAIAAVKGIGVLWPGTGTLRQLFSTPGAGGKAVVDEVAWEGAIQQVLAACREFQVACGIPSSPDQIEKRMKQGFSVFLMRWDDAGFETIRIGRRLAGRPM